MIKAIGIIILIVSCSLLGIYKSLQFSERLEHLIHLKWSLLMIQGDIRYQASPLPETLERLARKMEKTYEKIFLNIAERMQQKKGERFQDIWKEIWKEEGKTLSFQREDVDLLISFGENFSYLDKKMQMDAFEYVLQQLEEQIQDAKQKKQEGQKLYRTLGVMGGFFLAILLM